MRIWPALALVAAVLSGCGPGEADPSAARVEHCVDRLLEVAESDGASRAELRRYAREVYCERFERRGWVHDDGALGIAAHRWLDEEGGACSAVTVTNGEPREIPCDELPAAPGPRTVECALLRHVRQDEVREYVAELRREEEVACDDGTPLDELGVP